jgi:ribosomal protein S27AE
MKQNIKSKAKRLSKKRCPECGEFLSLVEHKSKRGGVIYNDPKIECLECGYTEKTRYKKHKTEAIQPMI